MSYHHLTTCYVLTYYTMMAVSLYVYSYKHIRVCTHIVNSVDAVLETHTCML